MTMYSIDPVCRRKINRACKKNPVLREAIEKKVSEILLMPEHFKPLRYSEKGKRRVHILKSFVLTYRVKEGIVHILDFEHHDRAYKR